MPSWLQTFAENQPVTRVTNAVRGLSLGTATTSDVVIALLWIGGDAAGLRAARHVALPQGLSRSRKR